LRFYNPKNIAQHILRVWISQTSNIPKKSLNPHPFFLELLALGAFLATLEVFLGGL